MKVSNKKQRLRRGLMSQTVSYMVAYRTESQRSNTKLNRLIKKTAYRCKSEACRSLERAKETMRVYNRSLSDPNKIGRGQPHTHIFFD